MNRLILPSTLRGSIKAISSKSMAHRLLIGAALTDSPTKILCEETSEDIEATVNCLRALGAVIAREKNTFLVTPIETPPATACLDCGESGSTLRFLLPLVCALGVEATFVRHGRLASRPLSPLREELERNGITLSPSEADPLTVSGRLPFGEYRLRGDVSSQFITGLLFALPLVKGESRILIEGRLESEPYLNLTLSALAAFGASVERTSFGYTIHGGEPLRSPDTLSVEGDWSNAAFALCAGAIGRDPITVTGLDLDSLQGDRAILDLLGAFGAHITRKEGRVTVSPAPLHAITIDASQIPDLVPILALVASCAKGQTHITGASRLRLKESDRLQSVANLLNTLGGKATELDDGLIIEGPSTLTGGKVDSAGDHRIAMCAAIASLRTQEPVLLAGSEAVSKSYPRFFEDFETLGLRSKLC